MLNETRSAKEWFSVFMQQDGAVDQAAQFCKVTTGTVLTWQNGVWPRGEPMYRLWVLLQLNHYRVEELEVLPLPSHRLALLMGCGICSYDEVREELGYSNTDSVFRLIRNEATPSSEKVRRLEKLLSAYQLQLVDFMQGFTSVVVVRPESTSHHGNVLDEETGVSLVHQASDDTADFSARLLQQLVRRVDKVDLVAFASRVKQDIPAYQIEKLALLLLELV